MTSYTLGVSNGSGMARSPREELHPVIDKEGLEIAQRIKKECRNDVRVFYWPIRAKSPVEL